MKSNCLNTHETAEKLIKLIQGYNKIYIISAWGSYNNHAKLLIDNKKKIKSLNIGITGYLTDPELIKNLIELDNAYIISPEGVSGIFHPKVYYFEKGDKAAAIIGSSNFTNGGLNQNIELNSYFKGEKNENIFKGIRNNFQLIEKDTKRLAVTEGIYKWYLTKHNSNKGNVIKTSPPPKSDNDPIFSDLVQMDWETYIDFIHSEAKRIKKPNATSSRLSLLRRNQSYFISNEQFENFNLIPRKDIAGTLSEKQYNEEFEDGGWGWFGTMSAQGKFTKAIININNETIESLSKISKFIDNIPRKESITRDHFKSYKKIADIRGIAIGIATRFLAMKRPDQFICINNGNQPYIEDALNLNKGSLNVENYWENVIEPIRDSKWYNSPRPDNAKNAKYLEDAEIWDYRVAMLDAVYYKP